MGSQRGQIPVVPRAGAPGGRDDTGSWAGGAAPRAAAILRGYSEEQLDEDAKEYIAWCAERVVEAPMAHFVNDRLVLGPAAA